MRAPGRPLAASAALAALSALVVLVATPRSAEAINLQTVNLCNCLTPACTNDIPGAGGTLACFVNITSCSYFLQAEPKNDVFRPMAIHVDETGAFFFVFFFVFSSSFFVGFRRFFRDFCQPLTRIALTSLSS
jgi:hypothetical protein